MRSGLQRCALAAATIGSVLTVAACGSSKPSAVVQADNGEAGKTGPQVMKDAVAAMIASGAVHGTGVGTEGKPAQPSTFDMRLQRDGISISQKSPRGSAEIIAIGNITYMRNSGDDPGASGITSILPKKYANRWVKFSTTSDTPADDTSSLAGFATSLSTPVAGVTINGKVTRGSLNGRAIVIVTESDGSSFSVAATGTPYLLQAVKAKSSKDDFGQGTITFSDYGKPITLMAPAGAVDVAGLLDQPGGPFPSGLPTDFPTDIPSS